MANVLLDLIEQNIRNFENRTQCQVTLPARILIQQFFIAVALENTGFAQLMTDQSRADMAQTALANLDAYLDFARQKISPDHAGEIGLLPLVQNANSFVAQFQLCPWWPSQVP